MQKAFFQQFFLLLWFLCIWSLPQRSGFLTSGSLLCCTIGFWPPRLLCGRAANYRSIMIPCQAFTPPPVATRHLLLLDRLRPCGHHGAQPKARPDRKVLGEVGFDFQGTCIKPCLLGSGLIIPILYMIPSLLSWAWQGQFSAFYGPERAVRLSHRVFAIFAS